MTIPATSTGTTKIIENNSTTDSVPLGGVLLNDGSGLAVVWGDYLASTLHLTMLNYGGSVGTTVSLNMGVALPASIGVHTAAAGTNRFAVVIDDWDDGSPDTSSGHDVYDTAYLRIFDSSGTAVSSTITLGTERYYNVTAVTDGSFIVTWFNDTAQRSYYTHFTKDGVAIANQTNKQLQAGYTTNTLAVAGDASGGFMYSKPTNSTTAGGSILTYVSASGAETAVTTIAAGYDGTLAYDGTDYWFFYSDSSDNVHATKISGSSHTIVTTYNLTGFTSASTPIVTALANGSFLIADFSLGTGVSTTYAKVSNTGQVLEKYSIASTDYTLLAPTSDSGGVILRNYDSGNTKYDLSAIEAFGSAYLDLVPPTITPVAISVADTSANDTLSASAATLAATSVSGTITGYSIQGGTTGISHVVSGVTYNVSKAGAYGTLYLQTSTGKYIYEPDSAAVNALQSNASDTFTVSATNSASSPGTASVTVSVTGVNDLPIIANLNGNAGTFKANASNPVADNDFIAPSTVAVTDVDSANLGSGSLQINLTSGTNDGYFFTDTNKVKAGTTQAGADARFTAGETVYVDTTGAGTTYTAIGTVAASGGVLHIDFNTSATPANVTWLIKNLTYSAPTEGLRNFTLVVNDGDGGTSAASAFSMNGTDGTPPTLSSSTPADNATNVAVATSPQITFSESVKFGSGKIYLVDVAANSVVEQFDVATAQGTADGKVSISGTTLTINPTAALDFGKNYAIKIDSGAITDLAGNAFAGISNTTTLDFTTISDPPTVAIAATPTTLKAGQHVTVSFTFSATPVGFTQSDIVVTGGAITGLAVDALNDKLYTADFSPSASQNLSATIKINAGAFTNAATQANTASNVLAFSGDTLAPTVASIERSAPAGATTNADSLTFLVTFSEAVSNVDAADFTVTGSTATVASVTPAGGNAYTVTVSGGDLASLNGTVGLSLSGANNVADGAANALASTTPTGLNQAYSVDNAVSAPTMALASDTGSSTSDGISKNGAVNVTLAADVAGWEYSIDSGSHWSAGSGTSFTLAEGAYAAGTVQVRQTDTAGNLSTATSNASALTIDATASAPALALSSDTGSSSSDGTTSNGTVDVTFAADMASWEYSTDSGAHWSAGSGTSFVLAEGSYAAGMVKVRYTDLAGNLSPSAGSTAAITVDTTASAPTMSLAADTGASAADGITRNPTVNVTLPADVASWQYSVDGGAHWTAGSGASFELPEGPYASGDIKVRYTDNAGNASAATANASAITVDTSIAAPSLTLASDTGASGTDGITSNGAMNVTLATDVASWEYSADGGAHWNTGSGASFTLATGTYAAGTVQVRQTDSAGNLSTAASNAASITIDQAAAAPAFALAHDNGSSGSDGITNDGTVTVTLPADTSSWEYSIDAGSHWSAGAGSSFSLAEGSYATGSVRVRYTDLAGNLSSAASSTAAITIDATAAAPSLAMPADSGASSSDGITKDTMVNVTLAADAAGWEYSTDSGAHWSAGSGTSFSLSDGSYAAGSIRVRQTDIAGNLSAAASNPGVVKIDTTAATPTLNLATDTGTSGSDGITNDGTVNAVLAADTASWEYSADGGAHWSAGSGTSFTLGAGTYAIGDIKVRYADTAGNLSPAGANTAAITVDQSVAAPVLTLPADSGASGSDAITQNTTVNVTLAFDAAAWQYSLDGGAHWTTGAGTSFTLAEGSYASGDIQVRQTDKAGNASAAASNPSALTIDTTASAPAFTLVHDTGASGTDAISNEGAVGVTLPGDANTWEYSTDGGAHWSAGTGTGFTLADGTYAAGAVKVRYTDTAGNLSTAAANAAAITIDTSAPAGSLGLAADTGSSASDGITSNAAVNVALPADMASWQYSTDGGTSWANGSGTTFNLPDGQYAAGGIKVRYTDIAGNTSAAAANASAITIDKTVGAPALALTVDTGASGSDGITTNGGVTVTLAADVASWQYSSDGGAHWNTGSGASFTLAAGAYAAGAVQVRQTDVAGNASTAASNAAALTIDQSASAPAFALAHDTGASASDGITSNGSVNVTLPADMSSWEYSVDGGSHWTAGTSTSFNLAQGSYAIGSLMVRYTDIAGNLSAASSNAAAMTVDGSVAAPSLALHADTGASSSDGITMDAAFDVTLAADAASWEYSSDSGASWTTGAGTSFALADGSYAIGAIQVRQTDVAGNQSAAASSTARVTIDTSAAGASFALALDTGASAGDGITMDGTINVSLPADSASWEYSMDSGAHWSPGSGASLTLAEGVYSAGAVKVRYIDIAGNASSASANASAITVDHTVATPALALAADTGTSSSDGLTNNTRLNVTLAADAASWQYSVDSGAHWTSGTGSSFTLAEGTYAAGAVQVRQTDIAGNVSAAGTTSGIVIDISAPAPALALAADTGTSGSDGITANGVVNTTLPGDAASWEYSVDGGAHWSIGSGTSFTLAEGSYAANAVQVRYTDNAGNPSTPAASAVAIKVDHSVAAPTFALAADTGASSTDGVTNNPRVNVTLAPDVSGWEYSTDAGAHWTAGASTSFTLPDGSYAAGAVQVRQTDLAGNLSAAASNASALKIDTAAAAASFAIALDSGKSATDGITNSGAVNVTLPADSASWEFSVDGGAHWNSGSGTSFRLAEGSYAGGAVKVRYTDVAGNLSAAASNASAITVDTGAPVASLALATDTGPNTTDGITYDPLIRVTLPADVDSWEYSTNSGAHWDTGHGSSFVLDTGLHAAGSVQVRYTDLAGNHSVAASNAAAYTVLRPVLPPPASTSVDGVPVTVGTTYNPDGSTSQVITVPVVLPTRVDDTGAPSVANIPLVSGSNGAPPPLAAEVPTGFGLQVTGSPAAQTPSSVSSTLVHEIASHTSIGSPDQGALSASGTGFLNQLPQGAPVLVQSITPIMGAGAPAGSPLVISAPPATPNGPVTALVIDASSLPTGTAIELQNVDFAALIGPMRVTGGDGQQVVFGDSAAQYIVLGADDDVLHGGAGDDIVGSEGGNDRIYGDDGNDLVFGGAGNDYIDGGSGTDTVLLQGASRADYSLHFDHGNLVMTQLHGGPDGTDTVANVELLRFAGASPDMGTQATLRRVYDTLLDRPMDAAGTAFWAGAGAKGMSMHDIAASMLGAPEASALARLSNAAFVDQLYLDALGAQPLKPASADERAHWTSLLDLGKADRADVLVGIANSAQKLALDAQEQSQIAFADTDAARVVRLYDTVLGRLGDEAGVNYWIGRSEAGVSMKAIVNAFLLSAEGQQHYGNTGDDQFVDALYNVGLGRHADAAEVSWWSDKLHSGVVSRADMVLYFSDSPEKVALIGHSTTVPGL